MGGKGRGCGPGPRYIVYNVFWTLHFLKMYSFWLFLRQERAISFLKPLRTNTHDNSHKNGAPNTEQPNFFAVSGNRLNPIRGSSVVTLKVVPRLVKDSTDSTGSSDSCGLNQVVRYSQNGKIDTMAFGLKSVLGLFTWYCRFHYLRSDLSGSWPFEVQDCWLKQK